MKHGNKVVSWESERKMAQALNVLGDDFFSAPEHSELFTTRKKTLDHPFFETLTRSDPVPGTIGWVGLDFDRRQIFDMQGWDDLRVFPVTHYVEDPLDVPDGLRQACMRKQWSTQEVSSTRKAWTKHEPAVSGEAFNETLNRVLASLASKTSNQDVVWMNVKTALPPGWNPSARPSPRP